MPEHTPNPPLPEPGGDPVPEYRPPAPPSETPPGQSPQPPLELPPDPLAPEVDHGDNGDLIPDHHIDDAITGEI